MLSKIKSKKSQKGCKNDLSLVSPDHYLTYSGTTRFVELLGRSNFSFLQAASHPEEMVEKAQELNYAGFCLSDLNGMYGVVRGFKAAYNKSSFEEHSYSSSFENFKYIIGSELTLTDSSNIVLVPINKNGYSNLCRLITQAKRHVDKGFSGLSLKEVLDHNENLIIFALPPWDVDKLVQIRDIFGDRLYIPVWKDFSWESIQLYQQALQLEKQGGFELFATQRPLMHQPDRKPLLDVLTCIFHKCQLKEAKTRLTGNRERFLRPLDQLAFLWKDRKDLLEKTLKIADRVQFKLTELKYIYPQDYLPPGSSAPKFLRQKVAEGLKWRYPKGIPKKIIQLIEHELKLINELNYEDYFLTLWDICEFAKKQDILYQGRGSAANSVVCYALGLTNVDPTQVDLLFERFISKERGEPPDIDIDFEHNRREEVIQYIYKKYGADHAAMVCTVICYRSRMALRETSKVMGVPNNKINAMVKFMGREGLSRLVENPEKVAEFNLSPQEFQHVLRLSMELQGFPRHLGIHTGGFVISQNPVVEIVPVEKASMQDRYVIQWNKDDVEALKLMKIDVLGLGMLFALKKCLDLLKKHKGIEWNLAQIPKEDPETYKMIQEADTVGVFQIESRAQMSLLPRLKPANYYDLVVEIAIVRPGPIQGGMVHPYVRRRQGLEKVTYAHPALKRVLEKTFGVPIFQEQIMQIAVEVAGFTPGEADELRRIMSSAWKRKTLMDGLRKRILTGMMKNGIQQSYAEQIYKTIKGFSAYGFPESHSASFALICYASCYLKRHHPESFTCALLNSQPMGFYSPRALISDAQRHGVEFFPLDINQSSDEYTLERDRNGLLGIRVGLNAIYGLRDHEIQKILKSRHEQGAFKNIEDLIQRTNLQKNSLIYLATSGGLESLGLNARQALWLIPSLNLDPNSLFFGKPERKLESTSNVSPLIPREGTWDRLNREYQTKGYSITDHPLSVIRPYIDFLNQKLVTKSQSPFYTAKQIKSLSDQTVLRVSGMVSILQRPPTAKGMCFITLEDETGSYNLVLHPQTYYQHRILITETPFLWVNGTLEVHQGVYNIIVKEMGKLPIQKIMSHISSGIETRPGTINPKPRSWR